MSVEAASSKNNDPSNARRAGVVGLAAGLALGGGAAPLLSEQSPPEVKPPAKPEQGNELVVEQSDLLPDQKVFNTGVTPDGEFLYDKPNDSDQTLVITPNSEGGLNVTNEFGNPVVPTEVEINSRQYELTPDDKQ